MKHPIKLFYSMILFTLGILVIGCQSSTGKVDDAKANVADAKEDLKDANAELVKTANEEEWRLFKNETELKIKDIENRIDVIQTKMKSSGKAMDAVYTKQIENLESKITNLKERVYGYEKSQSDWASFKREFNHDMDELGQALNDLTTNNKE